VIDETDALGVLGVEKGFDPGGLKKKHRSAAMSAHPDRGGSHDQMARVNKAYEHLQNRGSNIPKSKALAPTKSTSGSNGAPAAPSKSSPPKNTPKKPSPKPKKNWLKNNKGKAALGLAAAGGLGYVGQKLLSDKEVSMWSWER